MAEKQVFLLYAETQVHAGTGFETGVVDLPIQRERTTKFPIIQGVKGALRAYFRSLIKDKNGKREDEKKIFGSEPESDRETVPGSLNFSEAKILLFPVRNPHRLFVWVTCPLVLVRFARAVGNDKVIEELENMKIDDGNAISFFDEEEGIYLEEIKLSPLEIDPSNLSNTKNLISNIAKCAPVKYLQNKMKGDVVIVSDKLFSYIVQTMTEVVPRVRIDRERKTVKEGGLWYEEYLPQDTVMYFVVRKTYYHGDSKDLMNRFKEIVNEKLINIGGKETVGKGMMWVYAWGDADGNTQP